MKVFADFHHQALYHSLYLLFERRLGWKIYRQIGMEWYTEGFWNVFPHPGTAGQFLSIDQKFNPPKGMEGQFFKSLPNLEYREEDGIYLVEDKGFETFYRAITLPKFRTMKFDIVLSSLPQHIGPFNRLISEFQPDAKHIFQVGNAWGHLPGIKNILSSTAPFSVPSDINICFYHQEFDLRTFKYKPPVFHQTVTSYIHYMKNKELMNSVAVLLPKWQFRSFGAGMEDHIFKTIDIGNQISNSAFTWHWKPEGDGFGHTIHSSFACGRPAIVNRSHYRGKLAEKLFVDDVTCINTEGLSAASIAAKLLYFSEPERHRQMCEAAHRRFCEVVNFDEEEKSIREFLGRLK